ncbi:MAG TPA: hypothetical protein PLL78_07170 [Fimbriimonadaceae bacterium]|nr:hypothetical protein [Fimbriimonadaceae bacterium]HRJ96452.1 hypothetical protein [Fimbriimonadaceae bacterium]
MKRITLKLAAPAGLGLALLAPADAYVIKEVQVTSYEVRQDRLIARVEGRPVAFDTSRAQFFIFCDGSVRAVSGRRAEDLIRPGSSVSLAWTWWRGERRASRALILHPCGAPMALAQRSSADSLLSRGAAAASASRRIPPFSSITRPFGDGFRAFAVRSIAR